MRNSQRLRSDEPAGVAADLTQYWRDGYAIVRGFFEQAELAEISSALDQLYAEGVAHGRCFRHGNLFYNVARQRDGSEPLVRMVQWPSAWVSRRPSRRLFSPMKRATKAFFGFSYICSGVSSCWILPP